MSREAVHVALFNLLQGATGFKTTGRRMIHWSEVAPEDQPALFLSAGNDEPQSLRRAGGPAMHKLSFTVVMYANATLASGEAPATAMNPLIDAITSLFSTVNGAKQTLGGLVQWAVVSGPIETDEGVLGDQSFAIVPLEVVVSEGVLNG